MTMDADTKKAETEAGEASGPAGEERMFDEQGAPVGPGSLSDTAEGAANDVLADLSATVTQITAANEASEPLAEQDPLEAEQAMVAEAAPPLSTDMSAQLTIAQLKEKIMATAPINQNMKQATDTATETVTDAMNEAQSRAKAAYEKGTEAVGELTDFAKGNVEAVVESSKIIASGMQDLGRTYAEEAKTAYEQMTADLKELAAVKSPTELFQLQGKIMRRNFDTLMAASSKNSEAMMKLANEAFAPLSGRVNVAAEKISKVS
jgi:phasin family protein